MRNVLSQLRRELNAYFLSPVGYMVLTLFLLVSGVFFCLTLSFVGETDDAVDNVFKITGNLLVFFMPAITMRLLSEEQRSGTLEVLCTAPVSDLQIVLGKFLGALAFYVALIAPTIVYFFLLSAVGTVDTGPVVSGYVGLILLGGLLVSIGLLFSTVTRNQIVSYVGTVVALMVLLVIGHIGIEAEKWQWLKNALEYIGPFRRQEVFAEGVIVTRDVFYFVFVTIFFLIASWLSLDSRKWRV